MDDVTEQRFRKIKIEELIRIFSINTVIGTQEVTEENKDRKKFNFLYKQVFPFSYLPYLSSYFNLDLQ